mgnify:CR=1 FL=1
MFFGGAAGPGKTDALLMAALMYVDHGDYHAILFRRTYPNLEKEGSLIPRSKKWLDHTPADYNGSQHKWTFPSGATLSFGHMNYEDDRFNYNTAEFQFIGFDEATEFTEKQYRFLFSRLRKNKGNPVPLRQRSASNPIGEGFHWVRERFIKGNNPAILATLEDNPHIDKEEYEKSLSELDEVTKEKLLEGSWRETNQNAIYSSFTQKNIIAEIPSIRRFWVGVDYGMSNPTTFIAIGITEENKLVVFHEYWHEGGAPDTEQLTDSDYSKAMRDFLREVAEILGIDQVYAQPQYILVDPSSLSFINRLRADTTKAKQLHATEPANNEVMDGIRRTSALIGPGQLLVHQSCEHVIDEFYNYAWDEKAQQRGEDKPQKKDDHAMDAIRYVINGLFDIGLYNTIAQSGE